MKYFVFFFFFQFKKVLVAKSTAIFNSFSFSVCIYPFFCFLIEETGSVLHS